MSQLKTNNQAIIGLYPEWYPQSAVLIAWPDQYTDFSSILASVETTYLEIVSTISLYQKVIIVVRDQHLKHHVQHLLSTQAINKQKIIYLEIPYDDIWVRDIAPVAIHHNQITHLLALKFNAWGNQYHCENDAKFAQRLIASKLLPAPFLNSTLVLEGGAFDSNGSGDILTTASCLYDPKRNTLKQTSLHQRVLNELSAERLVVLKSGRLIGDDTGGHIDTLARFCSAETIAYTSCNDPNDEHYLALKQMHFELKQLKTPENKPYNLFPLPIPSPVFNKKKLQLPANYANFLIINNAVLVPQYDDGQDATALATLAICFPDRNIIPINCLSLIQQYGSLHCMTMNYPITINPEPE